MLGRDPQLHGSSFIWTKRRKSFIGNKRRKCSCQWPVYMVCVYGLHTQLLMPGSLGLGTAVYRNCLGKPVASHGDFGDH